MSSGMKETNLEWFVCMQEQGGGGGAPPRNLLNMHYEITSEATLRQTTSNKGGYK